MKKKILFVGLLLSVMCMFTSCLFIYADGEYDYKRQVSIRNTSFEDCEIVRVECRRGNAGNWKKVWDDGYDYNFVDDNRGRVFNNWNNTISFDMKDFPSGSYDFLIYVVYPKEGSPKTYGTYEKWVTRYTHSFGISTCCLEFSGDDYEDFYYVDD